MATNGGPNIIEDGLVFAVDAANKKSYPGSGTTWTDLAGSNDGTLTNGPTFDSGDGGNIVFDGVNDTVNIGATSSTTLSEITVSAIFSLSSYTNNTHLIVSRLGNSSNSYAHNYFLGIQKSKFYFGFKHLSQNQWPLAEIPGITVSTNEIYSLTATYNTTDSLKMYVNGILQSHSAQSGEPAVSNQPMSNNATSYLAVGSGAGENLFYSNAKIYNVKLYNRVLSSSEILQNYNALKGRFGL